jgi:hypothetical protein
LIANIFFLFLIFPGLILKMSKNASTLGLYGTGSAQGREQGRAPRRPTRPLGPLVKPAKIVRNTKKELVRNKKFYQKENP